MAERVMISESEILDAIANASIGKGPEEARTVHEIADTIGAGHLRVRKGLHQLKKQGRLQVHRVLREGLDGRLSTVAAYTISPP